MKKYQVTYKEKNDTSIKILSVRINANSFSEARNKFRDKYGYQKGNTKLTKLNVREVK